MKQKLIEGRRRGKTRHLREKNPRISA